MPQKMSEADRLKKIKEAEEAMRKRPPTPAPGGMAEEMRKMQAPPSGLLQLIIGRLGLQKILKKAGGQ